MRLKLAAIVLAAFALPTAGQPGTIAENGPGRILVMLKLPPGHFAAEGDYGGGYGNRLSRSALVREARRVARAHHLKLVTDWPMPMIGLDCVVMEIPKGASAESLAAEVSQDKHVEWSQPMHDYRTLGASAYDDPLYAAQPARALWRLDAVHRLATGRNVLVAVIDSGIDARHPDLAGQIKTNQNFVDDGPPRAEIHGTAVAGIIAAKAGNRAGIVGVAPDSRIVGLRSCWQTDTKIARCDTLSLAKALHFAIERKVPIINFSLGGPTDRLLAVLIDRGIARGMTIVAAYDPQHPADRFPAFYKGVIAVSDRLEPGVSHTIYVAPARDIPTPQPRGEWGLVAGSSYAAAHVSGLFALLRQRQNGKGRLPVLVTSKGGSIDAFATVQANGIACNEVCAPPIAAVRRR